MEAGMSLYVRCTRCTPWTFGRRQAKPVWRGLRLWSKAMSCSTCVDPCCLWLCVGWCYGRRSTCKPAGSRHPLKRKVSSIMALLSSRALPTRAALAPNSNGKKRHPINPSTSPTTVLVLLPCGSAFLISWKRDPVDWLWDRQHPQSITADHTPKMVRSLVLRACPIPRIQWWHSKMEAVSFKGISPNQLPKIPNPLGPGDQLSLRISASILAFSAYLPPAININHWMFIPGESLHGRCTGDVAHIFASHFRAGGVVAVGIVAAGCQLIGIKRQWLWLRSFGLTETLWVCCS